MQLQTTSPESKFPNEYCDVIFIQIDQHLKKLLQNTKGSRFSESRCKLKITTTERHISFQPSSRPHQVDIKNLKFELHTRNLANIHIGYAVAMPPNFVGGLSVILLCPRIGIGPSGYD